MAGNGVICMIGGNGDTSYANNSLLQRKIIAKTMPITREAIVNVCHTVLPDPFCIADLGCSSGQNTLLVIYEIIGIVDEICKQLGHKKLPEFQVNLNDLPSNDFNTLFRFLPEFQESLKKQYGLDFGPCLFNGVPVSFYERLFPKNSIHFTHASYTVHWLSKVPDLIETNNGNMYLTSSSPASIQKAYHDQFQTDFSKFLGYRAQEMIMGGRMVLTCVGRESDEASFSKDGGYNWELLSMVLREMNSEGLIDDEKLDSFMIPHYTPSATEIKYAVEKEGSFTIDRLKILKLNWIDFEEETSTDDFKDAGENMAKCMRAVSEPLLVSEFGNAIMDDVFTRYKDILTNVLVKERQTNHQCNILVSLTKTK